jgi:transcription initiation factor TFIIIB Brf1 subunit/transcription initiation factor TFIIB
MRANYTRIASDYQTRLSKKKKAKQFINQKKRKLFFAGRRNIGLIATIVLDSLQHGQGSLRQICIKKMSAYGGQQFMLAN